MKIYIINPDTHKPVTIDEWRNDDNPLRAFLLAIETAEGAPLLVMRKSYLPEPMDFGDAQKACADYVDNSLPNKTFRCPTRKECIDLYDARFEGLDEAVKLTGGDFAADYKYHWTCERDKDPRCGASYAWYSGGSSGYMGSYNMYGTYLALPVTLLDMSEANPNS
jgi:hypothetical protein